ncbi:MAG: LysM peptidoglycan-binding domain-containing protein [Mariprofundales bacterium]|nr:LysM peptidoglycan-binding domain-containing protein [Mariprofundales bacterium]
MIKLKIFMLPLLLAWIVAVPHALCSAVAAEPPSTLPPSVLQLKAGVQQPYVVQRGDTLWDIADHFFQDPHQWLKIWERNLTITNPDLIYPGNRIWFDERSSGKSGGLTTLHPQPQMVIKPVERERVALDRSIMLGALARQDLISPDAVHGVGYLLDARDGRLNFATGDQVYIHLDSPANVGDVYDVFRHGEVITAPGSDEQIGILTLHLGQLQVMSKSGDIYRAKVVRSFEEISRGDFLKPARKFDARVTPQSPHQRVRGRVIHIRNSAAEAGQNQVVAIDIGKGDGVQQGTELQVFQQGRVVKDGSGEGTVQLPAERIATLIVITPQQTGSLALVTHSSGSINLGDEVRGDPL